MRHEGGNLIYAISNGKLVSVEDVPAGLKCDCFCPACGEQLVAKKGQKMTHHFAHKAGTNCAFGYQTSLHLLAKDILANARRMVIPELYLRPDKPWLRDHLISPAREILIDEVDVEQNHGSIIPDTQRSPRLAALRSCIKRLYWSGVHFIGIIPMGVGKNSSGSRSSFS